MRITSESQIWQARALPFRPKSYTRSSIARTAIWYAERVVFAVYPALETLVCSHSEPDHIVWLLLLLFVIGPFDSRAALVARSWLSQFSAHHHHRRDNIS